MKKGLTYTVVMMSMRVNKYQQPDKDGPPTTAPETVGRKNERQQHNQSCVVKSIKQKRKKENFQIGQGQETIIILSSSKPKRPRRPTAGWAPPG